MGLIINAGLDSFYNALKKSFEENKIKVSDEADFYVYNLLTEYIKSAKFNTVSGFWNADKPLAILVKEAYEAPTVSEQLWKFVAIGDHSFFISSYFSGKLKNRNFGNSEEYCKAIGSESYLQACGLCSYSERTFAKLYRELGEKFDGLVVVASCALEQKL